MAQKNPYWLIREPGKTSGIGTVAFDEATRSDVAVYVFRQNQDEYTRLMLSDTDLEAVLVTLTYNDGQPVVTQAR